MKSCRTRWSLPPSAKVSFCQLHVMLAFRISATSRTKNYRFFSELDLNVDFPLGSDVENVQLKKGERTLDEVKLTLTSMKLQPDTRANIAQSITECPAQESHPIQVLSLSTRCALCRRYTRSPTKRKESRIIFAVNAIAK